MIAYPRNLVARGQGWLWALLGAGVLLLAWAAGTRADLTFPAVFEIVEETPNTFRLSLTVPLIKGRYMKVTPIVPDPFRPEGEPEIQAGEGSLTRTWRVPAAPAALHGKAFGLDGLLGTSQEVRFRLTTQDGRRHETILRPTQPIFLVPPVPEPSQLGATAARDGLRQAARHVGLWSWLACVLLSGMPARPRAWVTLAIILGFIGGWFLLMAAPRGGLSRGEVLLATSFYLVGLTVGAGGAAALLALLRTLVPAAMHRWLFSLGFVLGTAWGVYEGAGLVLRHGPAWLDGIQRIYEGLVHRWFAPFAADWAMAKLRIPVFSLGSLALLVWVVIRIKRPSVRLAAAGGLFLAALALLPYGVARASVPFLSPRVPSAQQARMIIEPMLSEIYHAFNLAEESETYDRLAEQISGDLVTDIYLDSRRRLAAGTRQGATVAVRQVAVEDVAAPRTTGGENPTYLCRWTVTAKVTHWQHSHQRRNVYEGDLRLTVADDRWKLTAIDLRSEEREVVPGSFASR